MKSAIIIYSITGNTRSVALKLYDAMKAKNQDVTLLEVKPTSDKTDQIKVEFIDAPDINKFNHLIFASPVHAFQLSKVMKTYLSQLDAMDKYQIDLFITHHFPFAWMGGHNALRQMKKIIQDKAGRIRHMISINWTSKKREQDINNLVEKFKVIDNT